MATVLVVDDSSVDRRLAGNLLEKTGTLTVVYACNGREALTLLERQKPDVIVSDMQMPEVDGLELVQTVRLKYPEVPVVLMTAHGSEEIAIQALQRGATSYVPKRNLFEDLTETVANVLEVAGVDHHQQRLNECLTRTVSCFELDNDLALIAPLIGHLEANLMRMKVCDENGLIRVAVALREALVNAMQHGNLEVSSALREQDEKSFQAVLAERRQQPPYRDRRVHVLARETRRKAVYVIRDQGPGFDPKGLPDPTDPANLDRVCGRGLLLIRTFMDEVTHSPRGNQIRMVKYARP